MTFKLSKVYISQCDLLFTMAKDVLFRIPNLLQLNDCQKRHRILETYRVLCNLHWFDLWIVISKKILLPFSGGAFMATIIIPLASQMHFLKTLFKCIFDLALLVRKLLLACEVSLDLSVCLNICLHLLSNLLLSLPSSDVTEVVIQKCFEKLLFWQ